MSNKKSRKFVNIMLSAMMLLGINATEVVAQTAEYGKNGVAYILLSSEFATPGVYRLNDYDGKVSDEPWRLYTLNGMQGKKASGLAANQNNQVFLLTTNTGGTFQDAEPGWLPTGIKFDENSSIYLPAAKPNEGGAADYIRSGCPHISNNSTHTGTYWKRNLNINGTIYKYAVQFGGPTAVRYLNGVSGSGNQIGTPIWDGTYWPQSTTNSAAIKHPTDDRKIILPSHFGALSYYLYGTKNEPAIQGLRMDGSDGRDTYIFTQANGAGYFNADSKHRSGTMFGCIVKRIYQKRENSLDLYAGNDGTKQNNKPKDQSMSRTQADVLKTVDVSVRESYGKLCGDNCIDGGELPGNKPIETALSTVTVVTSTNGNRYGYNPLGNTNGGNSSGAALRVVNNSGTSVINTSTDAAGQNFNTTNITNAAYLASKGITPIAMKTIGVSSNFTTSNSNSDYIYGSDADRFVVQDSWWGKGGVAYEYYEGDETKPGNIRKLDYMNNPNPTPEDLGDLTGDVDAIAIDGDGYLYALKTEQTPTDAQMRNVNVDINTLKVDSSSYSQNTALPPFNSSDFTVSLSGWRRDISTTNSNRETLNDGYIEVAEGQQRTGDYKVATLKQRVYKTVKRYPQGTGSLGTEEPRGQLFAGYDTWTNNIKKTSTGVTWDYAIWREEEGTKTSAIPAELAVVNVADSPISMAGTEKHYVIVTGAKTGADESYAFQNGQVIAEQDSLTFKVEGYKPVVDGIQRNLKDIGNIADKFSSIKLNSIPAPDGTYAHDENGDGLKSGFPSSMFEAGTTYQTTVKWHYAQVEDTVAVSLNAAKKITSVTEVDGTGEYKSAAIQFKQPGRYIIQADVTYNYFNNFGTAKRPYDLTVSQSTFTTEPLLVSVYANSLQLNKTQSYITNISMNFTNKKTGLTESESAATESDLDCLEGKATTAEPDAGKFGDLTIAFDAQFFREDESNTKGNLQTYDGIGVWDYSYYKNLYTQAKASLPGLTIPTVSDASHVYNHVSNTSDLTNCYSKTVYNPGKSKANSSGSGTFTAGSQVTGEPNSTDKEFIQYALYLRPITPQGDASTADDIMFDRGAAIKYGTFKDATFTEIGPRKYNVSLTVKDIDSLINTPRDPKDYTLDLEIIYPRVTWLNNDLGANLGDGHSYYSSVVPYTTENPVGPVHILSRLSVGGVAGSNPAYNQSFTTEDGSKIYKDGQNPYFTLCVRDKEIPQLKDNTKNLPYYETTGEPSVNGNFEFTVSDNNPFLSTTARAKESAAKITTEEAVLATDLAIQDLTLDTFANDDAQKEYILRSDTIKSAKISQTDNEIDFYKNDDWKLNIDYSVTMNSLSPERFKPKGTFGEVLGSIKEKGQLQMENWVGTLSYAIVGKVYDGYGKDGNSNAHYFYDETVYSSKRLPGYTKSNADLVKTEVCPSAPQMYLERIDNDPASIEVEMISQSDNRRWVFQLIEGVNDKVSAADSVDTLCPSTLIVKNLYLRNSSGNDKEQDVNPGMFQATQVNGTTNYYNGSFHEAPPEGCDSTVKVNSVITNAVPTFRRASRLLINVNIFDNCGFRDLQDATIKVKNGNEVILAEKIKCDASHNIDDGSLKKEFETQPRSVFVADMPMKVEDNQPQMELTVYCKDHAGNERTLVIPFELAESTFETRVLETKEERQ